MKILLKEKEINEHQLQSELKSFRERVDIVEKESFKFQSELDVALGKLSEVSIECERYVNYLRSCEEQLNISEKKRDELKKDAHETIRL